MRILYGVLGVGNGHITRAIELYPALQKYGQVDVIISGNTTDIEFPFPVQYRFKGLNFAFGKFGGINFLKSAMKNNLVRFMQECQQVPIHKYDLVITDLEPISAWMAQSHQIPCLGISNQYTASIISDFMGGKKSQYLKQKVLPNLFYTLVTPTNRVYGYHYHSNHSQLFTPLIRKEVLKLTPTYGNHYTAYLTAYGEIAIKRILTKFPDIQWEVFCKHTKIKHTYKNITFSPVDPVNFLKSMASCRGIICNSGFGTTSEAIALKKKILTIPMPHFEQQFNALSLEKLGATVIPKLSIQHYDTISKWIKSRKVINIEYKSNAAQIAKKLIQDYEMMKK